MEWAQRLPAAPDSRHHRCSWRPHKKAPPGPTSAREKSLSALFHAPANALPPSSRRDGRGGERALRIDPKIRRVLSSRVPFSFPFSEDRWQIMAWLSLCFSHTCPPVASCQWGAVGEVNWGKGYENKAQESLGFCSKKRKNGILSNNARHKREEIRSTTRQTAAENKLLSPLGSRSHVACVKMRDLTKKKKKTAVAIWKERGNSEAQNYSIINNFIPQNWKISQHSMATILFPTVTFWEINVTFSC